MKSLKQLQKENAVLKAHEKKREAKAKEYDERKELQKENTQLKNPKKYQFFKLVKVGAKRTGAGLQRMGAGASKANKKRKKKGKAHFGFNKNYFN